MSEYSVFYDLYFTCTHLMSWRDGLEIFFFSLVIYYFSLWLKKDRHKNLLGYFYGYCGLSLIAYAAHLSTITYLVCLFSPIALMLFIMMHQNTLQRNFIALRNIIPAQRDDSDWLEVLMRACLIALNRNKEVLCVIEHKDSLAEFLQASVPLNAQIKEQLLSIIFDSQSFDQNQLIWVDSHGKILGINAQWQSIDEHWITAQNNQALKEKTWKDDALFFSSKVDSVVFHVSPATRTFDIFIQGKQFDNVTAGNALPFIKKYLAASHTVTQGETTYAVQSKKHSVSQRSS